MKKRRIFIDMDGVLAVFHPEKSLEQICTPGYFENLEPQKNVVAAVRNIIKQFDVYLLTAAINEKAAQEKKKWGLSYLPELGDDKRVIVSFYGKTKSETVKEYTGRLEEDDILLDDFTQNLRSWHGVGVKLLNPINNTKRSWKGFVVNGNGTPKVVEASIKAIANI